MRADWKYYASGSNCPGEILGFGDIGHPVGFTVPDMRPGALEAALSVDVPLFIDSGAFGEKEFDDSGVPRVVRPITNEEWRRRLRVMLEVAEGHDDVTIVAPDSIGDQEATLDRIVRYRSEVARIAAAGARILVALPRGRVTREEFWRAVVDRIDGAFDLVPAFPMKKAAATPRDLARFARRVRPDEVHLLGMGPKSSGWGGSLEALGFAGVRRVTADSVLIVANVGRTNGPGGGPRALTAAQDRARELLPNGGVDAVKRLAIGIAFGPGVDHRDGCGSDVDADLILIGCVAGKRQATRPIRVCDLYQSNLWGLRRRYAESTGKAWGVVSAGLGVVPSGELAMPYEAKAQNLSGDARREWVTRSRQRLVGMLWPCGRMRASRVEVIAGAAYVDLVREAVDGLPVGVSAPLAGMGIGARQGWLKRMAEGRHRGASGPVQMSLF